MMATLYLGLQGALFELKLKDSQLAAMSRPTYSGKKSKSRYPQPPCVAHEHNILITE